MNNTKLPCSLNDTTILRNLILENPGLPLIIFCGEEAWHDEYAYEMADASSGSINEFTFYNGYWIEREEYKERLSNDLSDKKEYVKLSDEEYECMINQKIAETEFIKAIVIYVG